MRDSIDWLPCPNHLNPIMVFIELEVNGLFQPVILSPVVYRYLSSLCTATYLVYAVRVTNSSQEMVTFSVEDYRLNSNIPDATAMQVYRAVVFPGLVFANWRYARSPKNSPITTQAQ